ncbi:dephospho-CoA kinase [Butyrivibrio sp. NC3005]|uniref:dephospho-CoA kinase n=1 Tax=Butyrivibrio sp. NC3005 TaxID=1280685 RepID=UPI0003FB1EF3|nr:dephospho-CoA kinase [Butyrivibrio sp. NC3005]
MKIIGVTGGVGAGKSEVLRHLEQKYNCRVIFSDDVANIIKKKGMEAYDKLVELLGTDILNEEDGEIDRKKMANAVFGKPDVLKKINDILHPLTNDYIYEQIEKEKNEKKLQILFIEAALLIETGYNKIVDEMWYIFADEEIRRKRLKASRGYSDAKIDKIISSQLSESEFRAGSDFMIDNSGSLEDTLQIIDNHLKK